ncbi:MAG: biliverdin-producing heme oxygenase [Gammaproteobacteria bacterium]|nr:biliverdin-producing heme oxygenase [Gammaproteobacteria bacterium]
MNPVTLAEQLRNATREAHRQLDHHPLLRPLLSAEPDAQTYAHSLAALHGPLAWLEQQIAQQAPDHPDIGYQARTWALEQDLTQLCHSPIAYLGPRIRLEGRAELIGSLYVLEGARLGGQTIARKLQQTAPQLPTCYFADTGSSRWPDYWPPLLETLAASDQATATSAALAAFACFQQHLEACEG